MLTDKLQLQWYVLKRTLLRICRAGSPLNQCILTHHDKIGLIDYAIDLYWQTDQTADLQGPKRILTIS
jgi:hypothetical protein